jgi:hypothetical protein
MKRAMAYAKGGAMPQQTAHIASLETPPDPSIVALQQQLKYGAATRQHAQAAPRQR